MPLWDYQEKLVSDISAALRSGACRVLAVSPTGSGKTQMACDMADKIVRRDKTLWFVVHRDELVTQTVKTFERAGIPTGIIAAGHPTINAPVQVCMVQSLPSRLGAAPDFLIIDEAHHSPATTYQAIAQHCEGSYHIGFTATPGRPDGKPLRGCFDVMVEGPTVAWLIENGYLSKYTYYAPDIPDMSDVPVIAGEFSTKETEQIMQGKAIVGSMIEHWKHKAPGLLTVGFAPTVALSKAYAADFRAAGIPAIHLDGTTHPDERKAMSAAFARREEHVMWNVDIVGEGYDLSAIAGIDVTIEAIILGAPTRSIIKNRQRLGRPLRRKLTRAIILDHCGDITRHPLPCTHIEYSLDGPAKVKKTDGAPTAMARCAKCFALMSPALICPVCGDVREVKARQVIYIESELKEIKAVEIAAQKLAEEERKASIRRRVNAARTLPQLQDLEKELGYKKGWAFMKFKSRGRR